MQIFLKMHQGYEQFLREAKAWLKQNTNVNNTAAIHLKIYAELLLLFFYNHPITLGENSANKNISLNKSLSERKLPCARYFDFICTKGPCSQIAS